MITLNLTTGKCQSQQDETNRMMWKNTANNCNI